MGKLKKYREFTVTPGICGFKVKIGCTEAYFNDAGSLHEAIGKYLGDPTNTEEEYGKNDLRYCPTEGARRPDSASLALHPTGETLRGGRL